MSKRNRILKRNAKMREELALNIDYTEYNRVTRVRANLPAYVVKRINQCIEAIKTKYPDIQEVYLMGSYSSGEYIDEFTPQSFKDLKASVYKTVKVSDFDFETNPVIFDSFTTEEGYRIHLGKDSVNNKIKL